MIFHFESAETENLSDIYALYEQRVQWMDAVGLKQWNVTDYLNAFPLSYYQNLQKSGKLYVLKHEHRIVGALALFDHDDYWPDSDTASAYYIHHLVSDSQYRGIGKLMLRHAEKIAVDSGKEYLRLDCAVDNPALNLYYQSKGYAYAGTCQDGPYLGNRLAKKLL